jgi:hypothetical protein
MKQAVENWSLESFKTQDTSDHQLYRWTQQILGLQGKQMNVFRSAEGFRLTSEAGARLGGGRAGQDGG